MRIWKECKFISEGDVRKSVLVCRQDRRSASSFWRRSGLMVVARVKYPPRVQRMTKKGAPNLVVEVLYARVKWDQWEKQCASNRDVLRKIYCGCGGWWCWFPGRGRGRGWVHHLERGYGVGFLGQEPESQFRAVFWDNNKKSPTAVAGRQMGKGAD